MNPKNFWQEILAPEKGVHADKITLDEFTRLKSKWQTDFADDLHKPIGSATRYRASPSPS